MPSLGPFGEALGRVISPALEAVEEKITKPAAEAFQTKIVPKLSDVVKEATSGDKQLFNAQSRYHQYAEGYRPEDTLRVAHEVFRLRKQAYEDALEKFKTQNSLNPPDRSEVDLPHPDWRNARNEYVTALQELNGAEKILREAQSNYVGLPVIGNTPEAGRAAGSVLNGYLADRASTPARPLSPLSFLSPLNEAEVTQNLDFLLGGATRAAKLLPKKALDAIPPAARGVGHLLVGEGKPLDYGLTLERVKTDPAAAGWIHDSEFSGISWKLPSQAAKHGAYGGLVEDYYTTSAPGFEVFMGVLNGAKKLAAHPGLEDVNIGELRPVYGGGHWANSLGKAYLRIREDGGVDVLDDYRFYDTKSKTADIHPITPERMRFHSAMATGAWNGARDLVFSYLQSAALQPGARRVLFQTSQQLQATPLRASAELGLAIQKLLIKSSSFNPNTENINWYIDRMLHERGTPYPVVIKDWDALRGYAAVLKVHGVPYDANIPEHVELFNRVRLRARNQAAKMQSINQAMNNFFNDPTRLSEVSETHMRENNKDFLQLAQHIADDSHELWTEHRVRNVVPPAETAALDTLLKSSWPGKRDFINRISFSGFPNMSSGELMELIPASKRLDFFMKLLSSHDISGAPSFATRDEAWKELLEKHGYEVNWENVSPDTEIGKSRQHFTTGRDIPKNIVGHTSLWSEDRLNTYASLSSLERAVLEKMPAREAADASPVDIHKYFESLPEQDKHVVRERSKLLREHYAPSNSNTYFDRTRADSIKESLAAKIPDNMKLKADRLASILQQYRELPFDKSDLARPNQFTHLEEIVSDALSDEMINLREKGMYKESRLLLERMRGVKNPQQLAHLIFEGTPGGRLNLSPEKIDAILDLAERQLKAAKENRPNVTGLGEIEAEQAMNNYDYSLIGLRSQGTYSGQPGVQNLYFRD